MVSWQCSCHRRRSFYLFNFFFLARGSTCIKRRGNGMLETKETLQHVVSHGTAVHCLLFKHGLAEISVLGLKLKFLVARTTSLVTHLYFLSVLSATSRGICGRTSIKQPSAKGLLTHAQKVSCRQQLLEFPWIRQCVCVVPARGLRRAPAAQFWF